MEAQGENRRGGHYYMDVTGDTRSRAEWWPMLWSCMRLWLAALGNFALDAGRGTRHEARAQSPGAESPKPRAQGVVPVLEYHIVRENASGP